MPSVEKKIQKLLLVYSRYKKNRLGRRMSRYVVLPRVPFVTPSMIEDDLALLEMANRTIRMLENNSKGKGKVCPIPLFPCDSFGTDNAFLKDTMREYTPAFYAEAISNERQFTPEFHIVGHGDPIGIGGTNPTERIRPKPFARMIAKFFGSKGLLELKLNNKIIQPVNIIFHSCNSAYCHKVLPSNSIDEYHERMLAESFIGKFFGELSRMGYRSVEVSGFRGYYQTVTTSGAGTARILDHPFFPTIDIDAERAKFTLSATTIRVPTDHYFNVCISPDLSLQGHHAAASAAAADVDVVNTQARKFEEVVSKDIFNETGLKSDMDEDLALFMASALSHLVDREVSVLHERLVYSPEGQVFDIGDHRSLVLKIPNGVIATPMPIVRCPNYFPGNVIKAVSGSGAMARAGAGARVMVRSRSSSFDDAPELIGSAFKKVKRRGDIQKNEMKYNWRRTLSLNDLSSRVLFKPQPQLEFGLTNEGDEHLANQLIDQTRLRRLLSVL
ncbi:MAG: hypothetical protein HOI53_05125 [Francisellaceae bacterium]|jgi:hypothetical protein|nr:hypothetical protein [Francisellaceae bacterium]MBT6207387.1 hypothetical protein [Francisellaceae bacterium]MBT6539362.1 hypothetical protein [Francisellaceae bacterium]